MIKKQNDGEEYKEKLDYYKRAVQNKKSRNVINFPKPKSEDETEFEHTGNKDFVWWLI